MNSRLDRLADFFTEGIEIESALATWLQLSCPPMQSHNMQADIKNNFAQTTQLTVNGLCEQRKFLYEYHAKHFELKNTALCNTNDDIHLGIEQFKLILEWDVHTYFLMVTHLDNLRNTILMAYNGYTKNKEAMQRVTSPGHMSM